MVQVQIPLDSDTTKTFSQNNIILGINPCVDCPPLVKNQKLFKFEMEHILTYYSLFHLL